MEQMTISTDDLQYVAAECPERPDLYTVLSYIAGRGWTVRGEYFFDEGCAVEYAQKLGHLHVRRIVVRIPGTN